MRSCLFLLIFIWQASASVPLKLSDADLAAKSDHVFVAHVVGVDYIGSTSVPGLSAKRIINLMPEVVDLAVLDGFDQAMQGLGYHSKGELGFFVRRFYLKGLIDRTHHVHAFESGSEGLTRHLAVRDYLRWHPEEAAAYARLKLQLAARFPNENDGYCDGKHEFVQGLEKRALGWQTGLSLRAH